MLYTTKLSMPKHRTFSKENAPSRQDDLPIGGCGNSVRLPIEKKLDTARNKLRARVGRQHFHNRRIHKDLEVFTYACLLEVCLERARQLAPGHTRRSHLCTYYRGDALVRVRVDSGDFRSRANELPTLLCVPKHRLSVEESKK